MRAPVKSHMYLVSYSPLGSLWATSILQAPMSNSTSAGLSGRQKKQSSRYSGEDSKPASLQAVNSASACDNSVDKYAVMLEGKHTSEPILLPWSTCDARRAA